MEGIPQNRMFRGLRDGSVAGARGRTPADPVYAHPPRRRGLERRDRPDGVHVLG